MHTNYKRSVQLPNYVIILVIVAGSLTLLALIPIVICFFRRRRLSRARCRPRSPPQIPIPSTAAQTIVPSADGEMCERRTSTALSYGRTDHLVSTSALNPPLVDRSVYPMVVPLISQEETNPSSSSMGSSHSNGSFRSGSTRPLVREETRPAPSTWRPPVREETHPIPRVLGNLVQPTGGWPSGASHNTSYLPEACHERNPGPTSQDVTFTTLPSSYTPSSPHPLYSPENEDETLAPSYNRSRRPLLRVDTSSSTLSAGSSRSPRRTRRRKEGRESKPPFYSPGFDPPSYVQAIHRGGLGISTIGNA